MSLHDEPSNESPGSKEMYIQTLDQFELKDSFEQQLKAFEKKKEMKQAKKKSMQLEQDQKLLKAGL